MTTDQEQKQQVRKDDADKSIPEQVPRGPPALKSSGPNPSPGPEGPGSAPASASRTPSVPSSRTPYAPQFTAATELILKRLKGESTSLTAALSQTARSVPLTATISTARYEDTKNRLLMSLNTSTQMTLHMPAPTPSSRPAPSSPSVRASPAPITTSIPPSKSTAGMSAIRRVTAGLTSSSKSKSTTAASKPPPPPPSPESKPKKTKQSTSQNARGHLGKRKRTKTEDSDSESESFTSSSQASTPGASSPAPSAGTPLANLGTPASALNPAPILLTMTKSGRQVLKPASYDPAAIDAANRRHRAHHHGGGGLKAPRTAEQALCRRCSRLHSPASNQIVFCDGCNDAWHQLCHEPRIADEVVRDATKGWFCAACVAKKAAASGVNGLTGKSQSNKASIGASTSINGGSTSGPGAGSSSKGRDKAKPQPQQQQQHSERTSWAGRPAQAKRAYLSTLSQQELVALLMSCLDIHPDLPIFPPAPGGSVSSPSTTTPTSAVPDHGPASAPRSIFAGSTTDGLFPRASEAAKKAAASSGATANGGGSKSGGSGKGGKAALAQGSSIKDEHDDHEAEEYDPLAALWPRVGQGMYARLPPDVEDAARLVDEGDYEAFSVIVYDERGRKVEENGMKV
ncbi:hypothetical protein VTJ49DRAFT_5154 [Mycothermus thermophilus]|uniref:PHD-type domain-containing protein n=1 Tax=Humicola insolens TaxID=85995 RepID=A0ABR3V559_HUMIN